MDEDLIETSETPAVETAQVRMTNGEESEASAKVFHFKTGKPVDQETIVTVDDKVLNVHERMVAMDEHLNGMVERIVDEIGEEDFSEHTQLFLMIKKPGANEGLLWTTYSFRGTELIGALESAKLIAADRYFNGDD